VNGIYAIARNSERGWQSEHHPWALTTNGSYCIYIPRGGARTQVCPRLLVTECTPGLLGARLLETKEAAAASSVYTKDSTAVFLSMTSAAPIDWCRRAPHFTVECIGRAIYSPTDTYRGHFQAPTSGRGSSAPPRVEIRPQTGLGITRATGMSMSRSWGFGAETKVLGNLPSQPGRKLVSTQHGERRRELETPPSNTGRPTGCRCVAERPHRASILDGSGISADVVTYLPMNAVDTPHRDDVDAGRFSKTPPAPTQRPDLWYLAASPLATVTSIDA